jgi:uncharacterized protein (DUF983 family)
MKKYFNNWEWLKNSSDKEYSFVRVINTFSMIIIQPLVLYWIYVNKDIKDITNMWQFLVISLPSLTTISLFLLEVIKENKSISIKIGQKVFGINSGKKNQIKEETEE